MLQYSNRGDKVRNRINILLAIVVLLVVNISCGKTTSNKNVNHFSDNELNGSGSNQSNSKAFPAFPDDSAIKKTLYTAPEEPIDGNSTTFTKGSNNHTDFDNPKAYSVISSDTNRIAFAQYTSEAFVNRPVKINIDVTPTKLKPADLKTLDIEYHVAIANFTNHVWDWFGPYSDDKSIELNSATKRDRYLSPTNKLHYVILVAQNAPGQTIGASVVSTQTDSSASANSTLPNYSNLNLIHIGKNIEDLSIKRLSALSSDQELTLVWMHKEVTPTADNITSYEVYANEVGTSSVFLIGNVSSPGKDSMMTFKVITDVIASEQAKFIASKSYTFYIKSKNNQGYARRSSGQTVVIPSVLPPTNVACSTNLASGIKITWTKSANATGYKIYKDNQSQSIVTLGDIDNYLDKSSVDGNKHDYWVIALKGKEESGFSIGAEGTTPPLDNPMPMPQNVTASTDLVGRILITWDEVPGAEAYHVVVDDMDSSQGSTTNKFLDLKQFDLNEHSYKVRTISKTRPASDFTAPVKGKMKSIGGSLPEVSGMNASSEYLDKVIVNWDKVPGASYYLLYGTYLGYILEFEFNVTSNTFTDSLVTLGLSKSYNVVALTNTEKSLVSSSFSGMKTSIVDEYEPDDSMATAKPLNLTASIQSVRRTLHGETDFDWYKFFGIAGQTYYFWVNSEVNCYMDIMNSNQEIVQQDFFGIGPANGRFIAFRAQSSQNYNIKLFTYNSIPLEYYFVYIEGSPLLVAPDFNASTNRIDGVLISVNPIPEAEGFKIYKDTLASPIATILNDGSLEHLDLVPDSSKHTYWLTSYNKTAESSYSAYQVGQKIELDSYEPDNDSASAKLLTPTNTAKFQDRNIALGGDQEYLKLNAVKDTNYQFWSIGGIDTKIEILDSSMKILDSNDDAGQDYNFYLRFTAPDTALYYIRISGYNQNTIGNYQFFYTTGTAPIFDFTASASSNLDTGITLTWPGNINADGYRIYRDTYDNKIVDVGSVATYTDKTVSDTSIHKYWVQPFNATNEFAYSKVAYGQRVSSDSFEDDDISASAKLIVPETTFQTQEHSIYPAADEDWMYFNAKVNHSYKFFVKILNSAHRFEIYDTDGTTKLSESTSSRISWTPPKSGKYFLKIVCSSPTAKTMYILTYYEAFDTLPLLAPSNVKATNDLIESVSVSWDPVVGANRYRVYIDYPTGTNLSAFTTSFNYLPKDYQDHNISVTAIFQYYNELGNTIHKEGPISSTVVGKKLRRLNPSWALHSVGAANNFFSTVLKNGNPALASIDADGKLYYAYATVPNPTSSGDWKSYIIDSSNCYGNGKITLINGKPALVYVVSNKLIYCYSTKEAPVGVKGDWKKLTLTNDVESNYLTLAEIDSKPAIAYVDNSNLCYLMSKTSVPVDATPASWETPIELGKANISQSISLLPQDTTGYPAIAYISESDNMVYQYTDKTKVPTNISDWLTRTFLKKSQAPSLVMLNGCAAISFIDKNTTNLMFIYTASKSPALAEWYEYIVDINAFPNNKTQMIVTEDAKPAIMYIDTLNSLRVARTSNTNPTNINDWKIDVLDSSNTNPIFDLIETDSLTAISNTSFNTSVNYFTLVK